MDYIPLATESQKLPRAPLWSVSSAWFWSCAGLVVIFSMIVDWFCYEIFSNRSQSEALEAFCIVQIAIPAMWLGMSSKWITVRMIALVAVIALWATVYRHGGDAEVRGVILVLGIVVTAVVFCLRLGGLQTIVIEQPGPVNRDIFTSRAQFSILQILELTAAVAVLAALLKYHYFTFDSIRSLSFIPCAVMLAAALLAAWAIFGRRILLRIVIVAIIGIAMAWWTPGKQSGSTTPLPQMLYVVLALLPFRLLGYRLRWRWARISPPTLAKAE